MEKLQPNNTYHIFNHANGFENLFTEDENYRFFLEKYLLYINPVAETYAYCLLPNHFHLVVRIRRREVLELVYSELNFSKPTNFSKGPNFEKVVITNEELERFVSKQFSNLFSSYTQSFNKVNERRGSLFLKNFKREVINNRKYFESAVIYTHRNPVHHGFCTRYEDWSYTSYCEIKENNSRIIEIDKLFRTFGDKESFIVLHEQSAEKFKQSLITDL